MAKQNVVFTSKSSKKVHRVRIATAQRIATRCGLIRGYVYLSIVTDEQLPLHSENLCPKCYTGKE